MRMLRATTVALLVSVIANGQELQIPTTLPLPGPAPLPGKPSEAERYQLFTAAHAKLLEAEDRENQISLGAPIVLLVLGDLAGGVGFSLWASKVDEPRSPSNDTTYNIGIGGMVVAGALTLIGLSILASVIRRKVLAGREVDYWRDAMEFNR